MNYYDLGELNLIIDVSLRRVDLERVLPVLVTLPVVVEAESPKKRGLSTFKFGILCWRKKRIEN